MGSRITNILVEGCTSVHNPADSMSSSRDLAGRTAKRVESHRQIVGLLWMTDEPSRI